MRILLFFLVAAIAIGCRTCPVRAAGPTDEMIELTLRGQKVEGAPISWNDQKVHLLSRDGRLWQFNPEEARDFKKTSARFRGYSPSEFRAALLRELGSGYEVSGTGHYMVAHPADQRDKWAQRFEDLYRSFVQYFSVRGLEPSPPAFPLVGVVCRNQAEFLRHAEREKGDRSNLPERPATNLRSVPGFAQIGPVPLAAPNGVLGYYDVDSNRITLYDMGGNADSGKKGTGSICRNGPEGASHKLDLSPFSPSDSANWRQNAAVLIHEATHQTAFNTGVHSRYCPPPMWLAEGLAMLFEAPGVYDSRGNTRPGDRVNRDRLTAFRQGVAPRHRPEMLARIVASDDLFRLSPGAAYAEAWALSFFLVETEPRKYVEYLKRTASRPPFADCTAVDRTADFAAVFGTDWRMLEARFLRFIGGVK